MANVTMRICDRCKKEIKDRKGILVFEPSGSFITLELFRKSGWGFDKFHKFTADLCEDCSNKLVWFLDGVELEDMENKEEKDESNESV